MSDTLRATAALEGAYMIRLHHRTRIVREADSKIREAVFKAISEFDLTFGEILGILSNIIALEAMFLVRVERHPDNSDKKGDEE